jgi:DNA-binding response OmpR family regulator
MRILLVEDDKDLQRLLKRALTDAGYVVDTASDGEEGHYLGDTEPYDAVILDLGLPKMDGVRVLENWRKDGKKMPVLILTARDRWSDKVAGFDAGADDYLAKVCHFRNRNRIAQDRHAFLARHGRRQSRQAHLPRIPVVVLSRPSSRPRRFAHGTRGASL